MATDWTAGDFERDGSGKTLKRGLCRDVIHSVYGGARSEDRSEAKYSAIARRLHNREKSLCRYKGCGQINCQGTVPMMHWKFGNRCEVSDYGIIDKDFGGSEAVDRRVDQSRNLLFL